MLRWIAAGLAFAACQPFTPTPPFHFAETANTLPEGRTSVSGAVGFGSFEDIGGGLGAAARVSRGLGGGHELRAEATAFQRVLRDDGDPSNDEMPTPERPWLGERGALLWKLSWKLSLARWLAVSAGAGASHSATGDGVGADLAAIVSSPKAYFGGRTQPYAGFRVAVARPAGRDVNEAGGVTKGVIGALGTTYEWSPRTQLFLELGFLEEWNRGYFATDVKTDRVIESQNKDGGYLALGATFYLGGRKPSAAR